MFTKQQKLKVWAKREQDGVYSVSACNSQAAKNQHNK
jgi:hypothetical protein